MPGALDAFLSTLPPDHHVSVRAAPVGDGPSLAYDAHRRHYAASTMKTWLVLAAYREHDAGRLDLDRPVPVHASFSSQADGSSFTMQQSYDNDDDVWRREGTDVALRWLALRAIVRSSNLATNLVLEHVGVEAVRDAMAHLGLRDSRVERGIEDRAAREAGLTNEVSAHDLVTTYQALADGSAATPPSCRDVLAVHGAQQMRDGLPTAFPPGTRMAHKSGWVDGSTHDAGIVCPAGRPPFALAVCTSTPDDVDGHASVVGAARAAAHDLAGAAV